MYISMEEVHDYKHWMKLATVCCYMYVGWFYLHRNKCHTKCTTLLQCFHLWDLDARGFHKVGGL